MCLVSIVTAAWHQIARLNISFFTETSYPHYQIIGLIIIQHKAQSSGHTFTRSAELWYSTVQPEGDFTHFRAK